ncbi:hypothetical protein BV22DRAFT_1193356 [Leucogyrophana mollusca]|uniref:Uncharacterized protein n=1 Tax=Leucogyrophana mollusca TaxID=85980 RepID=A0ACB8BQ75_9AGAM|nr:hypothetical protein BV22DRAFT_1193356 [Leucogyrophana mollusca]
MAQHELQSGIYLLTSLSLSDGFVGRDEKEDFSLQPKKVESLPPGLRGQRASWIVEALGKGRYKLKAGGAPTGEIDHKVFAFLKEEQKGEDWIVKHRVFPGQDTAYTIERADERSGWVLPEKEPYTQANLGVEIRPLIVQPSEPPRYPPNQLWKFIRIDRE